MGGAEIKRGLIDDFRRDSQSLVSAAASRSSSVAASRVVAWLGRESADLPITASLPVSHGESA